MINKYALWKVIEVLVKGGEFSVREMSRQAKIGPSTSKACLDYLNNNNLLNKKVIGNVYQYSLNTKNSLARQIKNTILTKIIQEQSAKGFLCSKEKETIFFTDDEVIIAGIKTLRKKELKKENYLDIITI